MAAKKHVGSRGWGQVFAVEVEQGDSYCSTAEWSYLLSTLCLAAFRLDKAGLACMTA